MRIPYALPCIDERELAEVAATIRSHWLSRGPKTQEFEQRFAESVHAPYAVGLNSCTAALHLAQLALDFACRGYSGFCGHRSCDDEPG